MDISLDSINQIITGNFIRLSKIVLNSYYYTWVLTPTDKIVIQCLWDTAIFKNNNYYEKGIIISNIKEITIAKKSGVSVPTIQRSLKKLDYIGAIIKLKKLTKNNKYILGFKIDNNNVLYLLYYVILSCEHLVKKEVQSKFLSLTDARNVPKIKITEKHCLANHIRNIIIDAAQNRSIFISRDKDNEVILNYLFKQNKLKKFSF